MSLSNIFYILLLASASGLCISLIFYLNKITRTVGAMEKDIKDLTSQIQPLIKSAGELINKLNDITEQVKQPVDDAKEVISSVKERVNTVLTLEEKFRRAVAVPLLGVVTNISAVVNGVNTFWDTYTRKHKQKNLT